MDHWPELSLSQKCDLLRADVLRAFDALNRIMDTMAANETKLTTVAAGIVKLESQLSRLNRPKERK